jgi:hypothetical protein
MQKLSSTNNDGTFNSPPSASSNRSARANGLSPTSTESLKRAQIFNRSNSTASTSARNSSNNTKLKSLQKSSSSNSISSISSSNSVISSNLSPSLGISLANPISIFPSTHDLTVTELCKYTVNLAHEVISLRQTVANLHELITNNNSSPEKQIKDTIIKRSGPLDSSKRVKVYNNYYNLFN